MFGLRLEELEGKRGKGHYCLKSTIPAHLAQGVIPQPPDAASTSLLLVILSLTYTNSKKISAQELYDALRHLGLERNTAYASLMPPHSPAIYKSDNGGTVEYLLSAWLKQGYLEKTKSKDPVPVVWYSWGARAKLEFGEEDVKEFIAEFYDDMEVWRD